MNAGTSGLLDPTLDETLAAIAARLPAVPAGGGIWAEVGERALNDPRAHRGTLDQLSATHRIQLVGWTGHGLVLNTAALRALRIAEEEPDPIGGWYGRVGNTRRVNGVLHGMANFGARACLASSLPDTVVAAQLRQFFSEAAALGITSIQDMSGLPAARMVNAVRQAGAPIHWREIRTPGVTAKCPQPWGDDDDDDDDRRLPRVTISGFKYLPDGTPIERLAWLREAYTDMPGYFGRPYLLPIHIALAILFSGSAEDRQVLFHAVGDRTTETVLSQLASLPGRRARPRIEHGDLLTSEFWPLARATGAIVVQNPSHFTLPQIMFPRFGPARVSRMMPVRSLLRQGIPLAFGSDGLLHPYLNILFAAFHPVNQAEAVTREEAVTAYTAGSAYAEFAEGKKGTLRAGMLADLAVLSQDIFTLPLDPTTAVPAFAATQSVLTMVAGRVVHDAGALAGVR
jgi:predicted amidohydrolase YtcJ